MAHARHVSWCVFSEIWLESQDAKTCIPFRACFEFDQEKKHGLQTHKCECAQALDVAHHYKKHNTFYIYIYIIT